MLNSLTLGTSWVGQSIGAMNPSSIGVALSIIVTGGRGTGGVPPAGMVAWNPGSMSTHSSHPATRSSAGSGVWANAKPDTSAPMTMAIAPPRRTRLRLSMSPTSLCLLPNTGRPGQLLLYVTLTETRWFPKSASPLSTQRVRTVVVHDNTNRQHPATLSPRFAN